MNRLLLPAIQVALSATPEPYAADLPRATDRGRLSVTETADAIAVQAYEWAARHERRAGGCLRSVRLNVGRELLGGAGGARVNSWSEWHDPAPRMQTQRPDERTVLLTVHGRLCTPDGTPSPIAFTHVYRHRRELVRHELTLSAAEPVDGVTELVPFEVPGTGFRCFAACPSVEHDRGWHKWGAAQRGKVPGEGVAWEETMPARYLCLFTGGFGGIDWFPASDMAAWRGGHGSDVGSWRIEVTDRTPRLSAAVYRREEPVTLTGSTTWSWYTSWPCTTASFQPDPECVVVAPEYGALTPEDVTRYVDEGWNMVMPVCGWEIRRWRETPAGQYTFLQHDNSAPLAPVVAKARELGLLFVPYINLPAGCISDEDYARLGDHIRHTWSADPGSEQWRQTEAGFRYGHGCYLSEAFRHAVRPFIEQAWHSQDFDGLYYDFGDPQHCTNPAHAAGVHMWTDGLFEVLDWTRELMGPGKILFLHVGTEVHPCYATENYADYAIFYENYAYASWMGRLHGPAEFYEHFTAANNTGVSLATNVYSKRDVPAGELFAKMALWGDHSPFAGDPRFYAAVDPKGRGAERWAWSGRVRRRFGRYDLSTYEFLPVVREPARVSGGGRASAWARDGEVLLLVANLGSERRRFEVVPGAALTDRLGTGPLVWAVDAGPPRPVTRQDGRIVLQLDVSALDFALVRITPAPPRQAAPRRR